MKNEKVSIRISREEKNLLEKEGDSKGLSTSEYIRKCIFESHPCEINKQQVGWVLCQMQTAINEILNFGADDEKLAQLEKECVLLWQLLK